MVRRQRPCSFYLFRNVYVNSFSSVPSLVLLDLMAVYKPITHLLTYLLTFDSITVYIKFLLTACLLTYLIILVLQRRCYYWSLYQSVLALTLSTITHYCYHCSELCCLRCMYMYFNCTLTILFNSYQSASVCNHY